MVHDTETITCNTWWLSVFCREVCLLSARSYMPGKCISIPPDYIVSIWKRWFCTFMLWPWYFYNMVFTANKVPWLKHSVCHSFSPRLPVVLLRQSSQWLQTGSAWISAVTLSRCSCQSRVSELQHSVNGANCKNKTWPDSKLVTHWHFQPEEQIGVVVSHPPPFWDLLFFQDIFRFSFRTILKTWNYETKSLNVASHPVLLPPLAHLKSLSLLLFYSWCKRQWTS